NVELLHAYKRLADQQAAFASRNLAMGTPTVIIAVLLLYAFNSLAEAKGMMRQLESMSLLGEPASLGFGCKGITSEKDREEVLRLHNEYRANLTKGATVVHSMTGKKQALPAAKNMYELEWDCDLEAKAEDAMNMTCKYAARRRQVCIKFNKPVEEYGVQGVLQQWWEEGLGFDTLERRFEDFSVENFVNMASGRNTKIGCAVTKRGQRADVYCLYDLFVTIPILVSFMSHNGILDD
ncbi:SCP-like protein, partial [Ancylostoma ceylanicum]